MNTRSCNRICDAACLMSICLVAITWSQAVGQPSFISTDPRLPNPDQPYVSQGRFEFGLAYIQDFRMTITDPSQLSFPSPVTGGYAFDSTFDVAFSANLGIGLAPPMPISGTGTAHAVGFAPASSEPNFVFQTELVAMQLTHTTPIFTNIILRESPTLVSRGVTTVEGACYGFICPAVVLPMRISSFFDVFTELSIDGGMTWTPSVGSTRIVQTPEPGTMWLVLWCLASMSLRRPKKVDGRIGAGLKSGAQGTIMRYACPPSS